MQQRARRSTAPFWSFGAGPPMPEDALEFCDFLVKLETAGIPVVSAGAGSVGSYLFDDFEAGSPRRARPAWRAPGTLLLPCQPFPRCGG